MSEEEYNNTEIEDPRGKTDDDIALEVVDKRIEIERIEHEDGTIEEIKHYYIDSNNNDAVTNGRTSVDGIKSSLTQKAVDAASLAADIGCGVVEGVMSIYTVVSAYQNLQFLNLVSGFLESTSKMKAGDGTESPIHEYSTLLTTKKETVDGEGNSTGAKKTAMESAGMAWLFSGDKISSDDASVQNTNFESVMQSAMSSVVGLTVGTENLVKTFEACGYVKIATAGINLVSTVISVIPIIGGTVKFVQLGLKEVAQEAVKFAVQGIFSTIIVPAIIEKVAQSIIEDVATEWLGEDLGNAVIAGVSKYLGGNGSSGGQGPGSEAKVIAYYGKQQEVIAEEAEYQRSIRSPFDVSSPHTFLGTLAYSVLPMAYSSSGIMSAFTNISSLMTSSVSSMLPTASAVEMNDTITSVGDCPLLESTGTLGDAYCNPIIITDTSTVGSNPDVIESTVRNGYDKNGKKLLNDDGTINGESDLAKYVTYCGQRTSQYGVNDASITESIVGGGTAKSIIGMVPVLGDLDAIATATSEIESRKWITGEACVVSDDNPYWNGTDGDNQLYQRYAENQRLLENTDPKYKSTVTAYLENYYEENPIDESFEGTLARFSGMTKEQVTDTLALIEYYQFIGEYDALARHDFTHAAEPEMVEIEFNNNNVVAVEAILPKTLVYLDLRNRQATTA